MNLKQNIDGTYTLHCDSVGSGVIANYVNTGECNSVWNMLATTSYLEQTVEKITKKPEVRVEQRSSLEITEKVVAKFYKDGFFTDSKYLIPAIAGIDVFNENTVRVTFVNGNVQKATVQKGDVFSFEDGILRCIVKEMIGKEGNAILGKLLSYATDVYNRAETERKQKVEEEEKKRIATEKNRKKLQKHWEKKRAMEREKRIQEMAEAIVRAREIEKK